jgi:PAP2 superfamily protein
MACAVLVASALPHVLKHLFDRQRPDRSVMRGRRRRGIPRSGEPYDSFPSGHAINIGAIAGPLARLVPPHLRPAVWPVLTLLAASRVLLLAHYPSDVAAGLVLGTFIERVTDQLASGRFAKLSNCCCRLSAHSAARGIALRIRASDLRRRSSSDDGSATGQTPFLRRNLPRARRGRVSFQPQ